MMADKKSTPFLYLFILTLSISALLIIVVFTFDLVTHPLAVDASGSAVLRLLTGGLTAPLTVLVGLLIMRRVPGNVIGPLLILWAATIASQTSRTDFYATHIFSVLGHLPGDLGWLALIIIAIYFPTGRFYRERAERWVDLFVMLNLILYPLVAFRELIFVSALAPLRDVVSGIESVSLVIMLVFAPISLVLRYRAAEARERQQLKWLVWGFCSFIAVVIVWKPLVWTINPLGQTGNEILTRIIFVFPAVTIGNAILRHRLYDIDIIIRRTLIYATLTTILAAVYFGTVVLVQQVFRAFTGQATDLTIVISTLVIAALFNPLRHRIQAVIDRRLYRRKYDVEKTLEAFNRSLRNEADLETLKQSLVGVVQETMQPTSIALWINKSSRNIEGGNRP